jgi:AcrR family transcriptional regulator
MKRQKQIDESKDMISDAFVRLLQDHDFNDLTLSQIAEGAGVNRMTLYRHFKTKERIILYCAQKTLEEQAARNAGEGKLPRDLIQERLEWIRKLPQLSVLMQSKQVEELLEEFQVIAHLSALERFFGKRFDDDPNLFHFYFGGVNRIVKEWLLGECRQPAAEVTESIVSLTFSLAKVVRSG